MENIDIPDNTREFRCNQCNGKIVIPHGFPPHHRAMPALQRSHQLTGTNEVI
jgi:hypothetical protein